VQPLTKRYEALIAYYINLPELPAHFQLLADKLEALSKGAARILLADTYLREKNIVAAYENYLSVFADSACSAERRVHAGNQLANMIFTGDVILKEDGELDEAQTDLRKSITIEQRNVEGVDPAVMQQRALYAYEYLHGDSSAEASQLRKRFDLALSGETKLITQAAIWPSEVTSRYFEYYVVKNLKLLTEESFKQSFRQMHALVSTNKAACAAETKSPASGSAFFAVPKKEVEKSPANASGVELKEVKQPSF
jgi:TPR repeat protein